MAVSGVSEKVCKIELPKLDISSHMNLYCVKVLGDGSCFFHSVLRAFHREYIMSSSIEDRQRLTKKLRDSTATSLEEINPNTGKTEYETLGNGYYKEFNNAVKGVDGDSYSLQAMQKELRSNSPVDHAYIEILSNHLDLDIYLINAKTGDLYTTGSDVNLLYKRRKSIAILYTTGHYDILGIRRLQSNNNEDTDAVIFDCLFSPTHVFTILLYNRLKLLVTMK
jgi:hypothetical protein